MKINSADTPITQAPEALGEAFHISQLWKKHRTLTLLSVFTTLALIIIFFLFVFAPSKSEYSIDNYAENGSAAIANIGKARGLVFTQVEYPDVALSLAQQSNTTLVISHLEEIPRDVVKKINLLPNPVVFLLDSRVHASEIGIGLTPNKTSGLVAPNCEYPISRAGSIQSSIYGIEAKTTAQACYPLAAGGHLWVHQPATNERGERYYIAGSSRVANQNLAANGNAALLLATISRDNNQIIWWLGNSNPIGSSKIAYTPPYLPQILLILGALFFTATLVYGRRFGPLVHEDMPVTVSSLETMNGRANLYSKSRDYKHILNTNRAWVLKTLSGKTGITKSSTPEDVSNIVAKLTKLDPTKVYDILYHASAKNRYELQSLIQKLTELESESKYDD